MDEFMNNDDKHRAEVAALQNQIYRLTKYINDTEKEHLRNSMADPHDPFDNPTEYHEYQDDYTEIQPLIAAPDYKPDLEPAAEERSNLRSAYAVGGWCSLLRFFVSYSLMNILAFVIMQILEARNPDADSASINAFIENSSIWAGFNMLVFGLTNIGFALLGMKLSKQKLSSVFAPKNYKFRNFLQYSLIGFSLWFCSILLGQYVVNMFSLAGIRINSGGDYPATGIGFMVSAIYTCVVAPVTEELFFRGMLLKTFSRANQRFAIFFTAFMFGLAHGNVAQFILGFVLGIFFAHITLKHDSIIPAIGIHALLNTMNVFMSSVNFTQYEELLIMKAQTLLAFVGIIALILFRVNDKLPMTTPAQVRRGAPVARGSIGVVLAVSASVLYLVVNIYNLNG
ncbi:MAG: CPBP family intramembrane metalloprotease [Ruminococcus sp.]|nr:CPBP family intramembrane metalloprotease [Ruminococcus sp.]